MAFEAAQRTGRVWLPAAGFGLFGLLVLGRLVQLQVLEHPQFAAKAASEMVASDTLYARRGAILDRNGHPLALTVDTWDVYVSARAWRDETVAVDASETLAAAIGGDAFAIRQQVRDHESGDILVARDVPFDVGRELEKQGVPGVSLLPNIDRAHPEGDLAASIIGFIGADNNGLAGIEAALDSVLGGTPGRAIFERDSAGRPIPLGRYVARQPVPGADVVLTVDRTLQELAERELRKAIEEHKASGGTLIIMDPNTGEILALASEPSFRYSTLDLSRDDQLQLLRNRAITDLYEPGSVMKVITAAAALDAGVVTPNTTYVDTGVAVVAGVPIRNWDYNVYGQQTMTGVLQHSINTGAIFMVERLGAERFHQYLDAFGFGRRTGIELQGETPGIFRRPSDPDWSPVDLATQSFGQAISVTPLQMAVAFAAAINGGKLLEPHVVKGYVLPDGTWRPVAPKVIDQAISPQTSNTLREMLGAVVNPGWYHPANPRFYTAGGKSGTANVPVVNGYNDRQIASFVGFAPLENPRILVMVKLDDNADLQTGTQAAGPVFARVVDEALRYLGVPPDKGPEADR